MTKSQYNFIVSLDINPISAVIVNSSLFGLFFKDLKYKSYNAGNGHWWSVNFAHEQTS